MADSLSNNASGRIVRCSKADEADKPCFKHAAETASQISKPEGSLETEICKGCSKIMLSYIFLIQDMVEEIARKLSKDGDLTSCVQCLRQKSRDSGNLPRGDNIKYNNIEKENLVNSNGIDNRECETLGSVRTVPKLKGETQTNENLDRCISPMVSSATEVTSEPKRTRKVSSRRNSRRISREMKGSGNEVFFENCTDRNDWQTDFLYNISSSIVPKYIPYYQQKDTEYLITEKSNKAQDDELASYKEDASSNNLSSHSNSSATPSTPNLLLSHFGPPSIANSEKSSELINFDKTLIEDSDKFNYLISKSSSNYYKSEVECFAESDYSSSEYTLNEAEVDINDFEKSENSATESSSNHFEADVGFSSKLDYSGTENVERKINCTSVEPVQNEKTAYQNLKQWRTQCDSFVDSDWIGEDRKSSEAFVTICRNNSEALGCLVLGSSLRLSRTSRKLCVLVFDNVDSVFKEPLSSVFHVVQHVRNLKSIYEQELEYLKQMNLEKICIWCLVQFSKCVFLNPDCLIIRNCDELFQHEELSAVPDTGWPDCFNAGVFVFTPSNETLSKIMGLSQKQGQNNEGDQMLLNAYFTSWSSEIGKKLSFVYNLMHNASYTYVPAFQRFGHNVKIVQFLGGSKPWEVKFFTQTGQLDGDVNVHPKHVRFLSEWINTFRIAVQKLLQRDVYTYAFNERSISAEDIGLALCFPNFHNDFHKSLVKLCPALPKQQMLSPSYLATNTPGKTLECSQSLPAPMSSQISYPQSVEEAKQKLINFKYIEQNEKTEYETETDRVENETSLNDPPFGICLPGAIVGDYQGMKAWEQGHIDYEGCDSSENIMNRLSFLIHRYV